MGTADLIPGVSGGTIAFLSGIYEELLESVRVVSGSALKLLLRGQINAAARTVPWAFLVPLALGMATAIFSLAGVLSWLLETHPAFVWAFFFGLVLASTHIVMKRVNRWDFTDIAGFVIAAIATYILVGMRPTETPTHLPFIFVSGVIAICAMILPGISGSYILVLLGKYHYILSAVVHRDLLTLTIFTSGCVVGLSLFARVLSWLFARYHDIAIAVLAGIMLGSMRVIWPWKDTITTNTDAHKMVSSLAGQNILPDTLDMSVVLAILLGGAGMALVYALDRLHVVKERTEDIPETKSATTA